MKKIFKYSIDLDNIGIFLPKNSKILSVGNQGSNAYMWVEIDPNEKETETRKIRSFGTGHEIPDVEMNFIGTVFLFSGKLVFHIYEEM